MNTSTFAIGVFTVMFATSAFGQLRPTDKPEIPPPDGAVFASTIITQADKPVKRAVRTITPNSIRP